MNIIVIEDHEALREITVSALSEMGHVVRGLDRAEALAAAMADFRPHILVLDLGLPGEDGISLSRRLHETHPRLGIIMVTARAEAHQRIEGYEAGADIYLTKPTSPDELAAAIQALSRRITGGADADQRIPGGRKDLKGAERAMAIHQQLAGMTGKPPTQQDLSQQFGDPYRVLNQEFEARYGQTISAYLADSRLNKAYTAIVATEIPIKVISSRCGYSHVPSFNAAFLAKFGCSPGSLRKRDRK